MQFYNTTDTENSLVHEVWDLCDADNTSYPLDGHVTRRINIAYEKVIGEIISADGRYQWDDTNHTNSPRGTGTLVEGQSAYSFASEYLKIEQVHVLDANGVYRRVKPIDYEDVPDTMTIDEYFGFTSSAATTGLPEYYDLQGDTIRFYPAPTSTSVTLASGLRILFKRTADLFTPADTTQEPGLPSPYHYLLAYHAAIPYCMKYKKDRVGWLEKEFEVGLKKMLNHFGLRDRDRRHVMTTKKINYI